MQKYIGRFRLHFHKLSVKLRLLNIYSLIQKFKRLLFVFDLLF